MSVQDWKPASTASNPFVVQLSAPRVANAESPASENALHKHNASINQAELVGFTERPIEARDIAANAFEITLRDLERKDFNTFVQRLDLLSTSLEEARAILVPNYFGDQRFGSARHGKGFAAEALLKGDFETALRLTIATPDRKDTGVQRTFTRTLASNWGDWKRLAKELPRTPNRKAVESLATCASTPTQEDFRKAFTELPFTLQELIIDAYQSAAWNDALAAKLRAISQDAATTLSCTTDFGTLVFPGTIDPSLRRVTLDLPLADARIPNLRRPAFAQGSRACCVLARKVSLSPLEKDTLCTRPKPRGMCTLRCELPSGSYVTTLLRAIGQK
jgi:tRNA(Glu) U13 pseudouridine synthase TruD